MIRTVMGWTLALACTCGSAHAADLVVELDAVDPKGGRLAVFLYDSADGWDHQREPLVRRRAQPDGRDRLQLRFDGLAPGRYGVMVLHDIDGNGRFDTGLFGIPKDDYGFSNNPIVFGKPRFAQVSFEVPAGGRRILVRMK